MLINDNLLFINIDFFLYFQKKLLICSRFLKDLFFVLYIRLIGSGKGEAVIAC